MAPSWGDYYSRPATAPRLGRAMDWVQAPGAPVGVGDYAGTSVSPSPYMPTDALRSALTKVIGEKYAGRLVDHGPTGWLAEQADVVPKGMLETAGGLRRGDPVQTLTGAGETLLGAAPGAVMGLAGKAGAPLLAKAMAMVPGKAGKAARGIINTPDLRAMNVGDAIAAARNEPHLMQDAGGQFIGGPRGMVDRDQLQLMRNRFDAQVEAGVSGGDWYDRARAANREWAGDDPARQRLVAREEALWSAQATPDTNMNFLLQGHNAYEMGEPLSKVRTGAQARTYNKARDAGVDIPLGQKTGIYGEHLDPTKPFATTGTNDIWHARAFGYTNPGGEEFSRALTPQEHRFLDYETVLAVDRANAKKLGGRSDWQAHEIQAAPWVAGKGRGLAKKSGGRKTEAQGIAEASLTYPDLVDKYTAQPVYQQVPGTSWSAGNQPGRDRLYDAVGIYQRPTLEGSGGMVAQPLVGMQKAGAGVDPASRRAMDLVEGIRSYADMTPQGEWSKTILNAPPGEMGALHVPGVSTTPEQLAQLRAVGEPYGLGHVTGTGSGVTMTGYGPASPDGARLGKLLKQQTLPERVAEITGGVPQRAAIERNVIPMHDPRFVEGSGQATDRVLKLWEGVPSSVQGKLQDDAAIRMKAADNLRVMGAGLRADQRNALKILSEGGMRALAAARKAGKVSLPAVTAALVGAGAMAAQQGSDRRQAGPQEY